MDKKTIEELLNDYKERVGLTGEDYCSILNLGFIAFRYSEQNNYEQAARYSKMAYESSMRLYGPYDVMTNLQLRQLLEYYKLLGDIDSIGSVINDYCRIERESSKYELPDDEDEGIPCP